MPNLLLVMLGGAVGAGLRFQAGRLALAQFGAAFPWGTLIVNVAGGFLAGVLVATLARFGASEQLMLFLGVGLLGGFTTFSAFGLDAVSMIERGQFGTAGLYIAASVAGSIAAVMAGLFIGRIAS